MCVCVCRNPIGRIHIYINTGFPDGSEGKESAYSGGDPDLIHRSGRCPGRGNGSPPQYSCLENPMDRGAWRATIHGVAELDVTEQLALSLSYVHTHTHTYTLFQLLSIIQLLQDTELSSLCYAVGPYGLSILYTVVCIC